MKEARRNEIAYQILKRNVRRNFSFRDIEAAKRQVGNVVKEPEMTEANITKDELFEFGKLTLQEVFGKLMTGL